MVITPDKGPTSPFGAAKITFMVRKGRLGTMSLWRLKPNHPPWPEDLCINGFNFLALTSRSKKSHNSYNPWSYDLGLDNIGSTGSDSA